MAPEAEGFLIALSDEVLRIYTNWKREQDDLDTFEHRCPKTVVAAAMGLILGLLYVLCLVLLVANGGV
jgi:hypothetical protein